MSDQSGAFYGQFVEDHGRLAGRRWEGVLSGEQVDHFRRKGATLAFCPVQIGWVAIGEDHDSAPGLSDEPAIPLSWKMVRDAETLSFRPWGMSDGPTYRALLDDAALWRYMPEQWPGQVCDDMASNLIAISTAAPHHVVRAVLREGRPVGQVRLAFARHGEDRSEAEISYWIGRAYWGQGLGRRVVAQATMQAFKDHPALRRIIAHVHPDNHASARVLELSGYAHQGLRPDGWQMFEITG
jgi:RimJ/RimL family protein N-acetyltransferase